jgi:micrococcal nuclease
LRRRVFLLLLLGSLGSPSWADVCAASAPARRAAVQRVIDGDTLVLRGGQRLRLIGINAPEMRHDGRGPEAYAREARAALVDLSSGRVVEVQYGQSPHDRYGRGLAHLFLANGDNVQVSLLRRGLATSVFLPPNGEYLDCYVAAETEARAARRGIWSQAAFHPIAAKRIGRAAQGYRVVTGTVTSARCRRTGVWVAAARWGPGGQDRTGRPRPFQGPGSVPAARAPGVGSGSGATLPRVITDASAPPALSRRRGWERCGGRRGPARADPLR